MPASTSTRADTAEPEADWSTPARAYAPSAMEAIQADRTGGQTSGPGRRRARGRSAGRSGRFGRGRSAAPPPGADDEVHGADHDGRQHRVVDVMQAVLPALPVVAGLLADEREHQHPGHASGQREHAEAPERHPRDARGQRDERADY